MLPFLLKSAGFEVCHSGFMAEIEELLRIRNDLLQTDLGVILLDFLQDNLTSYAVQNLDAVEIKGMARLIQDIKDIPRVIEGKKKGIK